MQCKKVQLLNGAGVIYGCLVWYLKYVVSRAVAEVSDTDLGPHVPAAEGAGCELQSPDL